MAKTKELTEKMQDLQQAGIPMNAWPVDLMEEIVMELDRIVLSLETKQGLGCN